MPQRPPAEALHPVAVAIRCRPAMAHYRLRLMAIKLKATLDRAEAKDYHDIAEMISAGVSLPAGVSAFRAMFNGEPSQVLRSIGYFEDGDLHELAESDRHLLRNARDRVGQLPGVTIRSGSLTGR
jgi:hypothetical protein